MRKLCISLWIIAVVLLGCERCSAQVFLVKTEIRACTLLDCRVEVGTASSVCVGRINDRYYFVTAGHAFYSQRPGVTSSKVQSAHVSIDRQWVPAQVDAYDKPNSPGDVGLLSLVSTKELRSLPVAEHVPPVGSSVKIGGFPSGSPYAEVTGNVLPLQTADRQTDYLVSTAVVRGVSGGPVMHEGQVVGIVSASDFGSGTWCVGPEKVRARLTQLLGRMPDCGKPQPQIPTQPESSPPLAPNQQIPSPEPKPQEASVPPVPPSEAPDIAGSAAGAVASSAWTYLWPALAGALGISGPLGIGVYLAGRLIANRIAPKVVERVKDRIQPSGYGLQENRVQYMPVPQQQVEIPVPVHVAMPTTQNRYVDVPVINNEAEALKEAMRLEAEFTRTDHPHVTQHLRRVQDMADMILKGQKIEKPGWKL